jgi:hypothetical protein
MIKEFYFKGDRDYIQGPTFFDYIIDHYVAGKYSPKNIDFSSTKLTGKICSVVPQSGIIPSDTIIGQYKDDRNKFFVCETEENVTERVPYDESKITEKCIIENGTIIIPEDIPGFTFMEKVIAGYKFLLTDLYGERYGKYLFARILLDFIPEGRLSIKQMRIISNRFFEGIIIQHGKEIGKIFYGVRKI